MEIDHVLSRQHHHAFRIFNIATSTFPQGAQKRLGACLPSLMAPVRVIQDSDDDSDPISPERSQVAVEKQPTAELLHSTSQPAELSGVPTDPSMSSNGMCALHNGTGTDINQRTESLLHDLHPARRHLAEPTPQHLPPPTLEWNTSTSPTISKVNRRQTTMGIIESQKEDSLKLPRRKTTKTYGTHTRHERSSSWFDDEVGATGIGMDGGSSRKRQRMDGAEVDHLDELGANSTEEDGNMFGVDMGHTKFGRQLPAEIDIGNFFKPYSSKSSSDVNHLIVSSDYAMASTGVPRGPLADNVLEHDMLDDREFHHNIGQAGDIQGLRASSTDPMLGPHSGIPDFTSHVSNLEVAPPTLTNSQREQYDNIGGLVLEPNLDSTPDAGDLLRNLWGKSPENASTVPIASDERYNSQLAKTQKTMDGSSDAIPKGSSIRSGHSYGTCTPGRSKSFMDITSSSANRSSSPAAKSKLNRRTKTSHGKNDSLHPPSSIDSLALPPAVEEKAGRKSTKPGRKPKVQTDDEADELASDEIVIGLPKEQYKPRPSRSRSGTHDDIVEQPSSSQKKTSGPDSDEIAIGLPKEQYKPRPSRSRGGNTAEVVEALDFSKPKKKLKRGMTTGRILKKKIVDTDDEDDVIYVDERPKKDADKRAKPELVKEEGLEEVSKGKEMSTTQEDEHREVEKDVPNSADDENAIDEVLAQKPEPKKRGRKPKQTTEPAAELDDTHKRAEDLPSDDFLVNTPEAECPEPKKRGRKRKQTTETISEVEDNPETIGALPGPEDIVETIETTELKDPEPEPTGPKKRGRKRKVATEVLGEEPVVEVTADLDDAKGSYVPISDALKEKDRNLVQRVYPPTSKSKLMDLETQKPPYADDENQDSNSQDLVSPPETPKKATNTTAEKEVATPSTKLDPKAKGPTKHSPINKPKVPLRVGLSKRARIEPLLKIKRK
jgi:hypothetical protein